MGIILPALSFLLLVLFFASRFGVRAGSILAAVTLAFFSVVFIEAASLVRSVSPFSVHAFWVIALVLSGVFFLSRIRRCHVDLSLFKGWGWFESAGLLCIVSLVLVNSLVAFIAPPNTWDSMTYHLPRVFHWAGSGGVHFYPTQIERQLFNQPGAEYFLYHILMLTGNDRWFNFLQWMSYNGSIVAVSLVARLLGASLRGQVMAALFAATIPMAIFQATSTQNDLFLSFWVITFVALGLLLRERFTRTGLFAMTAALGLSVLVKGTFFVLTPFLFWYVVSFWKKASRYPIIVLGIVVVLVLGHYLRCWTWQGGRSFISSEQGALIMERRDIPSVLANGVAQVSSELMMPLLPVKRGLEGFVQAAMESLGVDDQVLFGSAFSAPPSPELIYDEDYASNPVHVGLVILSVISLWFFYRKRLIWIYVMAAIMGCIFFIMVIKWQPFVTRLHLPLFMLFAPLVGLVSGCRKWLAVLLAILLMASAVLTVIRHQNRPLVGVKRLLQWDRRQYYFMKHSELAKVYAQTAVLVRASACRDVGLLQSSDSWEYPLWALTDHGRVQFRSVGMPGEEFSPPCLIVTLDQPRDEGMVVAGVYFKMVWEQKPVQILAPSR